MTIALSCKATDWQTKYVTSDMVLITGANDILEVLDLSWNHIRGKGAIAVARGIGVSTGY